jgi:glycosyltransferase involved in cell wall biosynthesis
VAIGRVIDNPELAARLSSAGQERVTHWSWDDTAARVRELYARALARHAERHAHRR